MKALTLIKLSLGALLVASSVSCGKSKSEGARVTGARTTRAGTGPANLPPGQGYFTTVGYVTARDDMRTQFNQAVKHLVSAAIDPRYVGDVDNRNGVSLKGYVEVDSMGNVNASRSLVQLEIHDQVDGQNMEPIIINVKAKSGYATGYQSDIVFEDQYGSIRLTGTFDSNNFRGTISFQNKTIYAGAPAGEQPHGGTLGDFYISTCGFFRCQ